VASAIRIGNPASWQPAVQAAEESAGKIDKVTDEEILGAYKLVARSEGIFVEPACATALAGLAKCVQAGLIPEGSLVAATMTGHGLKDPDCAVETAGLEPISVAPNKEAVMKAIGL
jgi:threonine synthase